LSILKDLTDKVHMLLLDFHGGFWPFNDNDGANYCIGGCLQCTIATHHQASVAPELIGT
jgi:hypothetical protein